MKKFTPLVFLLAFIMIVSSSTMTALAATNQLKGIDYSNPASPVSVEMGSVEFMKILTGEDISDIEAEYLDSTVGDMLLYSDVIPQKYVETSYKDGTLSVLAKEYTYITDNGTAITWVPKVAKFENASVDLSANASGDYEGSFKNVADASQKYLTIEYTCKLVFSAAVVDSYKNYTYNYAFGLWQENADYLKKLEAYETYQKYLLDLKEYNILKMEWSEYESEYKTWATKEAAYNNYINVLLPEYEKAYAAWTAYQEAVKDLPAKIKQYEDYLAADKQYNEVDLPAYQKHMAAVEAAVKQLDVMESIYLVGETHGKQLYGTIMGDMVESVMDSVEAKYEELKTAGMKVDLKTIKETREYTKKLKPILEGYYEIRKKEQSEQDPAKKLDYTVEKFNYYKDNYAEMNECFGVLVQNLSTMFQDNAIKNGLLSKGDYYFRRYIQFVCQLYVVSTGLDDVIRNPDWKIYGEQTTPATIPATYVSYYWNGTWHGYLNDEVEHVLLDANLKPVDDGTISRNPSKVAKLATGIVEPIKPEKVEDPRKDIPDAVSKPTEPDAVKDPGPRPTPPDKELGEPPVSVPFGGDTRPESAVYTSLQLSLIEAIENGTLKKRAEGTGAEMELKTTLSRMILVAEGGKEQCIVSFYDYDGKTLLDTCILDVGEKIVYNGKTPVRVNTDKNTYVFEGWKNEDGDLIEDDLGVASGSYMSFYASYTTDVKTYNITWIIDGVSTTEAYEYGATPECKLELTKAETAQYTYVFKGWNTPISVVKGEATYIAEFEAVLKQYTVEWHYGDNVYTETYNYGDIPSFKQKIKDFTDGKYIYSFLDWDKEITSVQGDEVYTAKLSKNAIVEDESGDAVDVTLEESVYNVSVSDSSVSINKLLHLAWSNDCQIKLSFNSVGVEIAVNDALVEDLIKSGCEKVYIYINERNRASGNAVKYTVRFADGNDKDVSLAHGVTLSFKNNVKASTRAYLVKDDGSEAVLAYTYENGIISLKLSTSGVVMFKDEYKVTVGECENGSMIADVDKAESGDTVTITVWFTDGYSLDTIKVIGNSTGKGYAITGDVKYTFTMPDEDVTIMASFVENEYVIKFVVDGVVISEKKYHKGDEIEVPENPTKPQEGDKAYVFVGWSQPITPVSGDVTYVAEFQETTVSVDDFGGDRGNFYLMLNIAVVVAIVMLGGGTFGIIKLVKKKKAKKNTESEENANS